LSDVLEVTFDELLRGTPAPLARVPAAQRNELAMSINRLVRAARPLLQAAEETRKRKE
jgi:hypothetical protein